MKYLALRIAIALVTFVIGVWITAQVNSAAYYIWPDYDGQQQPQIVNQDHHERKPCAKFFVDKT